MCIHTWTDCILTVLMLAVCQFDAAIIPSIYKLFRKSFDTAILLDIVEHLHPDGTNDAVKAKTFGTTFLRQMETIVVRCYYGSPRVIVPSTVILGHWVNDAGHRHYSTWIKEDLLDLGYALDLPEISRSSYT